MDNNLFREYAALGASQQQLSSEIAALGSKVEEVEGSQVQFVPVIQPAKPLPSTFNCDQYIAEPVILGDGCVCVKEDVDSKVNQQVVDIINEIVSIVLMESNNIESEGNTRKETKLALVAEWQPTAFTVANESCVQCPVSSSFVNSSDEGVDDHPESVIWRTGLTASGAQLELCSQERDISAEKNESGSLFEADGKSKAQSWGKGSFSSVNRPNRASDAWLNVSYPEGCTTAKQNQSALTASPAAGSQADGGSVLKNGWPERLLGFLSPRSPQALNLKAPAQQPILSHRLRKLPKMQTLNSDMQLTSQGSNPVPAVVDGEALGLSSTVQRCSESESSTGAEWT